MTAGDKLGTINWSVPVVEGKAYNVELVSVASNSGKRCNYSYPDLAISGKNLSTTVDGDTSRKTVTICATKLEPEDIAVLPPPEPISTAVELCDASFKYQPTGGSETTKTFDIAIGYSKQFDNGLYEGAAICAAQEGQKQCINECVPREYDELNCAPNSDGTWPLSCAQCEWEPSVAVKLELKDPEIKYCWYYENRVHLVDSTTGEVDLNLSTFKPSPKKKSLSANIDVTTGSDCYTVTVGPMYGGRTYSYWYCPTTTTP